MTVPERTRPLSSIASLIQTAPITRVDRTSRRLVRRRSTFTVGSPYADQRTDFVSTFPISAFPSRFSKPSRPRAIPPHPDPGASHPAGPRPAATCAASPRPAPARRRPSRCRSSTASPRAPRPLAAQVLPRAGAQPDARAGDPDRRQLPRLWPAHAPVDRRRVRRHLGRQERAPGRAAASTSWSPRPAACSTSSTGAR